MPETMSPNRYSFTGYDGSHVKMGRKPNRTDLAFSDEQLKNKRERVCKYKYVIFPYCCFKI